MTSYDTSNKVKQDIQAYTNTYDVDIQTYKNTYDISDCCISETEIRDSQIICPPHPYN